MHSMRSSVRQDIRDAGDLFAFAALNELNTDEIASIVGTPIALDLSQFV